jgi:hypothetical protein
MGELQTATLGIAAATFLAALGIPLLAQFRNLLGE